MMIAFFQVLFVFGHRPWKVADPKTRDHMGVGAFNMVAAFGLRSGGHISRTAHGSSRRHETGKVIKNAGFAQRNVMEKT